MTALDYADLPEVITVREFKVKGIVYVTTLLNAKQFNKQELASLYKERWKIESDFLAIKTHVGMDMLRCKPPEMVLNNRRSTTINPINLRLVDRFVIVYYVH